jgi:signal peptidase I
MFKNFLIFTFELVKIVIISLVIIVPIRYFLIQPFYVKGASMEPNFHDHEYLIIDEISYRFKDPKRGDIVVFRYPKNPQEYFIKRIIGLPNETIEFEEGKIFIYDNNSERVELVEEYLPEDLKTYSLGQNSFTIDENEYFVMGDNRNSSKDSRSFGPIADSYIIGKVLLRGWPFSRISLFPSPEYEFILN